MKRLFMGVMASLVLLLCLSCGSNPSENTNADKRILVAVGIVPEATFVQKVGGKHVQVVTMVPPGNNPENYQPTAAVMRQLSDAQLYFTLRLPSENASILPKLSDFNAKIRLVDLQAEVAAKYPLFASSEEGEDDGGVDHHIWLSPKRAIVMVQAIADELSTLDAINKQEYQANAASYIAELKALDQEILTKLSGLKNRSFIVYHPAYAYFADDYALKMVSIQLEGKQASAKDLQRVIDFAKLSGITTVFYQQEFDSSQARTIASEIGGTAVAVAPLSQDYTGALRDIVDALTHGK